jgi:CheY-like chemotaxis protein
MGVGARVLIVDDDASIRDALAMCLECEGFEVAQARDGREGVDRVREERPDLILLDLLMPVMNGRQFLDRLRADDATRDIPVVLMTGASSYGSPFPRADAVLPKPFEIDELIDAVRTCRRVA